MSEKVTFTGKVVRAEPGGFGIVEFDNPIGPGGNNYGLVSASGGTTSSNSTMTQLKPGVRVYGTADADERQIAAVTTINITKSD